MSDASVLYQMKIRNIILTRISPQTSTTISYRQLVFFNEKNCWQLKGKRKTASVVVHCVLTVLPMCGNRWLSPAIET